MTPLCFWPGGEAANPDALHPGKARKKRWGKESLLNALSARLYFVKPERELTWRRLSFPQRFSLAFLGQKPSSFRKPQRGRRRVSIVSKGVFSLNAGPGGSSPWCRVQGPHRPLLRFPLYQGCYQYWKNAPNKTLPHCFYALCSRINFQRSRVASPPRRCRTAWW